MVWRGVATGGMEGSVRKGDDPHDHLTIVQREAEAALAEAGVAQDARLLGEDHVAATWHHQRSVMRACHIGSSREVW